jgi:hypothetical protein
LSEFSSELAVATVLIRPDTTKFRATLEAELAAATRKPIVIPVVAETVGGRGTSTAAIKSEAAALQLSGAAATEESVALKKSAVAAREAAVAHEQLARGANASILTLLGIRGATLAASAPFLAGAAAITVFSKAVKEASSEIEAAARVGRILGDACGQLRTVGHGGTEVRGCYCGGLP